MVQKLIKSKVARVILEYFGKYRREVILLATLSIVSAITNAVVPFLAGRLIDSILTPAAVFSLFAFTMPLAFAILLVWVVVQSIANFVDRQIAVKSERFGAIIYQDYISRGVSKILELPLSFHKTRKVGEVFDRIQRATEWLYQVLSRLVIDLAPQILSILVAIVITFTINPVLASILVGATVIYAFIIFRASPTLARLQEKMWRAYSFAFGEAMDAVVNVQAVKQASAEDYERKDVNRKFGQATIFWTRYFSIWGNLNLIQRFIVTVTQLAIFLFSIWWIREGRMTIGELVMFNGYAAMLLGPFVVMSRNWQSIQNAATAIERSENILALRGEEYATRLSVSPKIRGEIEFKEVCFRYGKTHKIVLDKVSFRIRAGQRVALVGESGVGKTTLIDLISRYYSPTSGKIYMDGRYIKNFDLIGLRSHIAVVPQEVVLFNDTIKKNIKYGRFTARDEEIFRAARLANADEFIQNFPKKYNQLVGERGIKLSTGQKQRIAIARAILRNPRILILDEPTSALDAKSEKLISESFKSLMRGRTTFTIAHRFSTVREADMILVLDKGRIVEQGKHSELIKIKDGVYRKLYKLQIGLS